jgi:hypothetical protein
MIVEEYVPTLRLFAFAFTAKLRAVPVDTEPEVEEGVSQFETPEIE